MSSCNFNSLFIHHQLEESEKVCDEPNNAWSPVTIKQQWMI